MGSFWSILSKIIYGVLTVALALSVTQFGRAQALQIGRAAVDITPPLEMPFQVPQRPPYLVVPAEGIHDPLHAKAVVFAQGEMRAAIVACDVTALPTAIMTKARQLAGEITSIPPENIMITATHTHSGPVLGPSFFQNAPPAQMKIALDYLERLPGMIAQSVQLAEASLTEARIQAAIGEVPDVAFNRRFLMKSGLVSVNPGLRAIAKGEVVRPAGPTDPSLPMLYFDTPDGEPLATMINFAIHLDTMTGFWYSADFPYQIARILADVKGPGMMTHFTIGAAGDINHYRVIDPRGPHLGRGPQESARIGTLLAGEVVRNYNRMETVIAGPLKVSREMVPLIANKKLRAGLDQPTNQESRIDGQETNPAINPYAFEAEVMTITIGDQLAFIGMPGEIFVEHGLVLKIKSPFKYTFLNALANGGIGYVPTLKALSEGAYGASPTSTRCTPGSGEALVSSALRQLIANRAAHYNPNRR